MRAEVLSHQAFDAISATGFSNVLFAHHNTKTCCSIRLGRCQQQEARARDLDLGAIKNA